MQARLLAFCIPGYGILRVRKGGGCDPQRSGVGSICPLALLQHVAPAGFAAHQEQGISSLFCFPKFSISESSS